MRTTATGLSGATEHVWEIEGGVMMLGAENEGKGRTESTGRCRVLACPWCILARSGMSGHHGARRVPGLADLFFDQGGYRRVQGS
jgi:hypothetical protein